MLTRTIFTLATAVALATGGIAGAQQSAEPEYFVTVDDNDENVQAAADFAVETRSDETGEILSLIHVVQAEESVAPGIHYRLTVSALDDGQTRQAYAEVTQDSDGSMSLSEWVWNTAARD